MKRLNVAAVLLIGLMAFSALMASEFKVGEFRVLHSDFKAEAEPVQDLDGNYCAVLRIDGKLPRGFGLEEKVYKTESAGGREMYYYISARETSITLTAPGFSPLTVDVPSGKLMLGKVYYLRFKTVVSTKKEALALPVMISSNPDGAKMVVNGQAAGYTNTGINLLPGIYELLLGKPGYEILADRIEVRAGQNNVFTYRLVAKNTQAPPPPPPSSGQLNGDVVIWEDFSNSNLDNWIKLSGEWVSAGGYLSQSSQARPAIILTGNEEIENYMIELDAKKSSGAEGFVIVVGSKRDNKNGLAWDIGGWSNTKSILLSYRDFVYNRHTQFKSTESRIKIDENKWYKIKIIVQGSNIKCYLGGNIIIDFSDPEVASLCTGRIGIGTYRTKAYFDNIKVTRLP